MQFIVIQKVRLQNNIKRQKKCKQLKEPIIQAKVYRMEILGMTYYRMKILGKTYNGLKYLKYLLKI